MLLTQLITFDLCTSSVKVFNNLINHKLHYCKLLHIFRYETYGDTIVLFLLHRAVIFSRSANLLKTVLANSDQRDFPKTKSIAVRYLFGERYDFMVAIVIHIFLLLVVTKF